MIIMIISNLILQGSLLPFFDFLVFLPNIALVSVVVIAIFKGKYYGAFFGLFMGIFQDALFTDVIGVNALIFFLIGYTIGSFKELFNKDNMMVPLIITSISTIVYNLMYSLAMYFLSKNITLLGALQRIISVEIIYNCILVFIVYKIFLKIFYTRSVSFGRRERW